MFPRPPHVPTGPQRRRLQRIRFFGGIERSSKIAAGAGIAGLLAASVGVTAYTTSRGDASASSLRVSSVDADESVGQLPPRPSAGEALLSITAAPSVAATVPASVDPQASASSSLASMAKGLSIPAGGPSVPALVAAAYQSAQARLAVTDPSCGLPWWLLAGVGKIESNQADGGRVAANGVTRGSILGPVLDGTLAGTAAIPDTDGGALDSDPTADRAVGPMQFLPSTWRTWGVDADGDGVANPNDINDAALAAGRYLCANAPDGLSTEGDQLAALYHYNASASYGLEVIAWAEAYRDGTQVVAGETGNVPTAAVGSAPPLSGLVGSGAPSSPTPPAASAPLLVPTRNPTATPSAPATPTLPASPTTTASPTGTAPVSPAPTSNPPVTASPGATASPTSTPCATPVASPWPGTTQTPSAAPTAAPTTTPTTASATAALFSSTPSTPVSGCPSATVTAMPSAASAPASSPLLTTPSPTGVSGGTTSNPSSGARSSSVTPSSSSPRPVATPSSATMPSSATATHATSTSGPHASPWHRSGAHSS